MLDPPPTCPPQICWHGLAHQLCHISEVYAEDSRQEHEGGRQGSDEGERVERSTHKILFVVRHELRHPARAPALE